MVCNEPGRLGVLRVHAGSRSFIDLPQFALALTHDMQELFHVD